MIISRSVFQLKFGKAKEAKAAIKEGIALAKQAGINSSRACVDVSGPFYTMVFENEFESLGAFEQLMSTIGKNEKWQKWYASFSQLVESGHREIYSVVD